MPVWFEANVSLYLRYNKSQVTVTHVEDDPIQCGVNEGTKDVQ